MAHYSKMLRHRDRGFTIVELLVTVVIVSILATVAIPMAEMASRRSKEQELRQNLRSIRQALDAYRHAADEGRILKSADESGYPPHLQTLVDGVPDASSPEAKRIFFLRRVPRDPFSDAQLSPEDSWGKRSYESSAEDPKEGKDVYDIYSMSPKTGLNGTAYREW